jgi:hypothetical protein
MKHCSIKLFAAIILMLSASIQAYTYHFNNTTGKDVEIAFKLAGINEPTETIRVPAKQNDGKPGTASRSIGGWRIGLCFKGRDDLSMRILPDGASFRPLLLQAGTSDHDDFLATKNVPFNVFHPRKNIAPGDMANATYRYNQLLLCFDRTFTIVETNDHQFMLVYE